MKVAIYVRVSTNENRQDTTRQIHELTALCQQKNWELISTVEEYVSGRQCNRRGVQQIIELASKGLIKKVLIHEPSRFGRNLADAYSNVKKLCDLGVSLYVLSQHQETLDEFNNETIYCSMILPILLAISQEESRNHAMRVKSGLANKRRKNNGIVRDKTTTNKQSPKLTTAISALHGLDIKNLTRTKLEQISKNINLSYSTLYRAKQKLTQSVF